MALAAILITASANASFTHAARPQAQVSLTMWGWADRNLCALDYQKAHPNVKITYVVQNPYIAKLNVLKRAGGSGLPDVEWVTMEDIANLYQLGFTSDLTNDLPAAVRARYAPGTLEPLTFNGQLRAFPDVIASLGIWYNVKNMKAAGLSIPTSYDQVFADAAKLARTKQFQISWFGADGNAIETLAWGEHAGWFTQHGTSWSVNIDTPLTESLATKYVAAVRSGGVLPDDPFGPISGKAYANGKVVYAVGPNWLGDYGIKPGYPKQGGEWTFVASLPSVGWWGGSVWIALPQSQHLAEARQVALYCSTSPTFQSQVGTVPSYMGVYNVAGAFKPDSYYANPAGVVAQLKLSTQRTGTGWSFSPNNSFVDAQAGTAVAAMINGAPVHATLARYQQQVIENLKLIGVSVQ
jgi:ABC-type glycerol-3-phosphate transport system substrate-binding protein